MPVTLVIKTPHIKLPDRTFFCETTSDVFQLKTYLQDQYPTKPKPTEQRLIYSGKLLLDHEILKDFLRDLDSEPMHTIHLVYTLTHSSGDVPEQSTPNMTNVEAGVGAADDGLRLRNTVSSPSSAGDQWVNNRQFTLMAGSFANQPTDSATQQMLWWQQQTYAQNYWAQYMQYISNTAPLNQSPTPAPTVAASPVQIPSPPLVAAAAAAEQQDRQQQEAQQRRPPLVVGGVAQEEDDDGGIRAARDWLDWFYIGSRFAILLGVMYFYSSLPRFMLVTLIVAGIYLYQKAIHQRRVILLNDNAEVNNNNNNNNHGQAEADADRADAAEESVETESTEVVATAQPSGLNIALNLFIGFFTSLIPEVPAPEAL